MNRSTTVFAVLESSIHLYTRFLCSLVKSGCTQRFENICFLVLIISIYFHRNVKLSFCTCC